MSPLTEGDRRLAGRAGRGDDAAFSQLAERHRERLVRAARRRLGDRRDDAEDVVQDALVSALRALRAGKRPQNPAAWLSAIVVNGCHDHHRAAVRRATMPLLEEADQDVGTASVEPHHRVEERAQLRGAVAAVRALPDNQREALVGYELGGRTYEELAAEHGWSVSATKSLLWRARTSLAVERERWAAAIGGPLVGLAHALRTGTAALVDKPAALIGAHQAPEMATYAAVAVLAVGGAGAAQERRASGEPEDDRRAAAVAVERAAERVAALPAAATTPAAATPDPVKPRAASAAPARAGALDTPEDVLRACSTGAALDGAAPAALAAARRDLPGDLEQYTDCAADIRRAIAAG